MSNKSLSEQCRKRLVFDRDANFNEWNKGLSGSPYSTYFNGSTDENARTSELTNALCDALAALEKAIELMRVPEHCQDDDWYEEEKKVGQALADVEKCLEKERVG